MRIRTMLAAAAAPAIAAAALFATTGAASAAAVQPSALSAYFWNTNGHALGGPQQMPGGVSLAGGYLAKVTADEHNANIVGKTITITGALTKAGPLTDQLNGGDPYGSNPTARVYFEGGSAGTNSNSPDGYEGQQWWADASISLNSLNTTTGTFKLTATVDPTVTAWSDYNGQQASDNTALFSAAASHVHDLGLSFGGGWFFENGVTGPDSLTITNITVSP